MPYDKTHWQAEVRDPLDETFQDLKRAEHERSAHDVLWVPAPSRASDADGFDRFLESTVRINRRAEASGRNISVALLGEGAVADASGAGYRFTGNGREFAAALRSYGVTVDDRIECFGVADVTASAVAHHIVRVSEHLRARPRVLLPATEGVAMAVRCLRAKTMVHIDTPYSVRSPAFYEPLHRSALLANTLAGLESPGVATELAASNEVELHSLLAAHDRWWNGTDRQPGVKDVFVRRAMAAEARGAEPHTAIFINTQHQLVMYPDGRPSDEMQARIDEAVLLAHELEGRVTIVVGARVHGIPDARKGDLRYWSMGESAAREVARQFDQPWSDAPSYPNQWKRCATATLPGSRVRVVYDSWANNNFVEAQRYTQFLREHPDVTRAFVVGGHVQVQATAMAMQSMGYPVEVVGADFDDFLAWQLPHVVAAYTSREAAWGLSFPRLLGQDERNRVGERQGVATDYRDAPRMGGLSGDAGDALTRALA